MGTLRAKTIEPATGTTLTLGASGDSITVSSDSIKVNTFKDAGGNTLFTSDGAGTLSSVNSAFLPAGPILISTSTASNAASIEITSGIDSTYDEYMFVLTDINPVATQADFGFQVNASGQTGYNETMTTTLFSAYQTESGTDPLLWYNTTDDQAQGTAYQIICRQIGNGSDENGSGEIFLYNPASTTYVKQFYSRSAEYYGGNGAFDVFIGGYLNTTSAINALTFKISSGNIDAGTIAMYGIS